MHKFFLNNTNSESILKNHTSNGTITMDLPRSEKNKVNNASILIKESLGHRNKVIIKNNT